MQREKQKSLCRKISYGIIICLLLSLFNGLTAYADTWPDIGESAIKSAQPHFSGYRVRDMEVWSPQTDPYAEYMQAKVPLQTRNEAFRPTQVNPKLTAPVEIMLMQGDYGNSFFDSTIANNSYGNVAFNFWQYTDYFCPWHGAATIGTPRGLYDPANSDWRNRGFEFGIVNIPNQAYINAAHKNGVMAIACIYFDPAFRPGQSKSEMFAKDDDGKYIVANKLIEMARFYGIDGYFLNDEEWGYDEFKPFMAQISAAGLWTQFYDTNSAFNARKSQYLKDATHGKIHDSVFVNYGWSNVDSFVAHAEEIGVDPYKAVFLGIEANQGAFANAPSKTGIDKAYDENKNPKMSVALFTPSDMYQRGVDSLTGTLGLDKQLPIHQRNEYQWMIAERERMYFSGVKSDPTDTGKKPGFARPEVVVNDAGGWVGVADFKSESSVISGKKFYSNFNIGKGVQYFVEGQMLNDEAWTNLNDQDILPTWQWWFDTQSDKKLKADFDFGAKDIHNDTKGQKINLPYTQVGAWHGGSSLVVYGDLEAGKGNFLRVFKTDLDVTGSSKAVIRYRKSSMDNAEMKLGLVMKDAPETIEKLEIQNSANKGEWVEATVDLSRFTGKQIAALGFVFESAVNVENYQMNIGQIRITDQESNLSAPENFKVEKVFVDGQVILRWNKKEYSEVDKYRVYSVDADGVRHFLGGIYDDGIYVKNHFTNNNKKFRFELVAVSKDGKESATTTYHFGDEKMPNSIAVREVENETTKVRHAAEAGKLEISWTAEEQAQGYEIHVYPLWMAKDDKNYKEYRIRVGNVTSYTLEVPEIKDGYEYDLTVSPISGDNSIIGGVTYRGRFHDSYARPMTKEDVIFHHGHQFSLKSPLTRDWKKVTAEFQAKGSATREILLEKIRGVSRNYHNKVNLGHSAGTLFVTLEDYSGNTSVLELEYDQSYREGLKALVNEFKPLIANREQAKLIYTNSDLDEILDRIDVKIKAAELLLESTEENKEKVLELEAEINAIKAILVANPNLITLTFDIVYPNELPKDKLDITVVVKDSEEKSIEPLLENKYPVKEGDYNYSITDSYGRVLPVKKTIQITGNTVEEVKLIRKPYSIKMKKAPSKLTYKRGEELELSDGEVEMTYYSPAGSKTVAMSEENFVVRGYDKNKLGSQEITLEGFGRSLSLNVKVEPADGEAAEMADLSTLVEEMKPVLTKNKFRYAGDEKKEAFQTALEKAEEILTKPDSEASTIIDAKEKLQEAYDTLDGDMKAPLEIVPTATLRTHSIYFLRKMLDNDANSFAWLGGAQKAGQEIVLTFSRPVKMKGFTLEYPTNVGSDFIRAADVQVYLNDEWKTIGKISGEEKQSGTFDEVQTDKIRLLLTQDAGSWYKVGEWTIDYTEINQNQDNEDPKARLKKAIEEAKALREHYKYYNADIISKLLFDGVIQTAEEFYEKPDATEEEIAEFIDTLKSLSQNLNGEETKKGKLVETIAIAKTAKDSNTYKNATEESKARLDEAMANAESVRAKDKATQEEVDKAEEALTTAIKGLDGDANPQPQLQSEILLPYIPEMTEESVEVVEQVQIEEEDIALSSPEEMAKFEEITKNILDEKTKELIKELVARKINAELFAKRLSQEAMADLASSAEEKFEDVKADVWYVKELGFVAVAGLVTGFEDATFRGEKEVTGKEFITMLVRASGVELKTSEDKDWFTPYLVAAEKAGLLNGVKFDLSKKLTREEVAALAYNFAMLGRNHVLLPNRLGDFTDRDTIHQDYLTQVDYLWEKGVLKGYEDGSYRSEKPVKRQEIVTILYRLLKNK
ncbi:MAG: S-layer homology domain-containing protein [Eubacteriales bacterium]|nr:S-layer homology domain-containing protein [Eubacteriales bacterium]